MQHLEVSGAVRHIYVYICRTSKCCILYIYSTNTRTEYFKHAAHSPFFFSSKCRLFNTLRTGDADLRFTLQLCKTDDANLRF